MIPTRAPFSPRVLVLVGTTLLNCSSSSSPAKSGDTGADAAGDGPAKSGDTGADAADDPMCFPDTDGLPATTPYTFDLTVNDTGFSKMILATQNQAQVTLTLMNTGTKPHGFKVGCTSVLPAYPNVPAGCPTTACFDSSASIPPLDPGASATIMFETPLPDGLIYPITSNEPADSAVPGLNIQWSLM